MMSLHKLTAGSGYDYLTRQVAAMDSTEKGHTALAEYYDQKGESPGIWLGSGLAGIDGLQPGDVVTVEQMRSLFGAGEHPLAGERLAALGPEATQREVRRAVQLGQRFGDYDGLSGFRVEVGRRLTEWNRAQGRPDGDPVDPEVRARVRTEVGGEHFHTRFGREPQDARELAGFISRQSRPTQAGVAGYDVTFSPVKSVSALWALADLRTARIIERCQDLAVADAMHYLEIRALYTRRGRSGVRQVETRGMVAAAFTHRDSRAGDPDLHTHVAIANKVQALDDGAWLSIDGRALYKANVAASEVYNTALEHHLGRELGLRFHNRRGGDPERPVREIEGMHSGLLGLWSQRTRMITRRQEELSSDFQQRHGRTPTPSEQFDLGQRATLETRDRKHAPRSLAEQRRMWAEQAEYAIGRESVARMITDTLHPEPVDWQTVDEGWLNATAARVVGVLERHRASWQEVHARAEALRQVRVAGVADPEAAVDRIVDLALGRFSARLTPADDGISEPATLRRADGSSVYTVAGSTQYTSQRILDAEQRLLRLGGRTDGMVVGEPSISLALLASLANGVPLNPGQVQLVRTMASSGARRQVAIAPAGAGKTTAMSALAQAWREAGGDVIGLAPSATAAKGLAEQLGGHADTLHALTHGVAAGRLPAWAKRIGPRSLIVVDEAGMADTLTLEAAVSFIVGCGGSVRLVGDDRQLAAVEAGGVLRDLIAEHDALRLTEVVRFSDSAEARASLALREGRPDALGFYLDHGRVHVGDASSTLEQAFSAWAADRASGLNSLMLAPTRELVAELNARARAYRLGGMAPDREALLADGNRASVGDTVVTRRNERRLRFSQNGWVRNGERWMVLSVGSDASLVVGNRHGWRVRLPAGYVADDTELGYASTIHGAQGMTVDTVHGVVTGAESRQQLYTMLSRGRHANHAYVQVVGDGDPHTMLWPESLAPPTATEVLEAVLAHDEAAVSATSLLRQASDPRLLLKPAVDRYVDALGVAAEQVVGADRANAIRDEADQVVLWASECDAWPALRSRLLMVAASGADPIAGLRRAVAQGGLDDARDPAALLAWRLERPVTGGPLPWLDGIPAAVAEHPDWGPYLQARFDLVHDLATQVREGSGDGSEPWRDTLPADLDHGLVAQLTVWRAALGVSEGDVRPTGPVQPTAAAARWQHSLDQQVEDASPAVRQWTETLHDLAPQLRTDPHTPALAAHLVSLAAKGEDVDFLLRHAMRRGPLPDDRAAAALQYRIEHPPTRTTWEQVDNTRLPSHSIPLAERRLPGHPRSPGRGIGI